MVIAEAAQKDLDEAMPALNEAMKSLDSLKKNDIAEVKAYGKPPALVEVVMEAVMILKQSEPTWGEAKRQLGKFLKFYIINVEFCLLFFFNFIFIYRRSKLYQFAEGLRSRQHTRQSAATYQQVHVGAGLSAGQGRQRVGRRQVALHVGASHGDVRSDIPRGAAQARTLQPGHVSAQGEAGRFGRCQAKARRCLIIFFYFV